MKGKEIQALVQSGSMEPWIGEGETVTAIICELNEISPLDTVLFWQNDKIMCHVYLRKENGKLLTKPFKGKTLDPPWEPQEFLGKVISPKFSKTQKFLYKIFNRIVGTVYFDKYRK